MELIQWIVLNWKDVLAVLVQIIGVTSLIVKLTPTLKDANILLPIVKFLGKYIALNKTVNDAERPIV